MNRGFVAASHFVLAALLSGCGSGVGLRLSISINAPPSTLLAPGVVLSGVAALPAGSVRTGGTVFQPIITCQPGTFSMFWANDANGTRGGVIALWNCPADQLTWSSGTIPLAFGDNRITVTMVDSVGSVASAVTVTRR
ncbi:MAG: hypothetical protein ROZ64_14270 [Burkholderiaceae bacterium]|nr:hypothetical protein [Burkholderiaceae bacterium]